MHASIRNQGRPLVLRIIKGPLKVKKMYKSRVICNYGSTTQNGKYYFTLKIGLNAIFFCSVSSNNYHSLLGWVIYVHSDLHEGIRSWALIRIFMIFCHMFAVILLQLHCLDLDLLKKYLMTMCKHL